jgi:hypothetical protein
MSSAGEIQISPVGTGVLNTKKVSYRIKAFSKNNRAVISDLSAKYAAEHRQNELLRQLLIANGIEIPEEILQQGINHPDDEDIPLLQPRQLLVDGNIETLKKMLVSPLGYSSSSKSYLTILNLCTPLN